MYIPDNTDFSRLQSRTIDALRFPLAILVIFVHAALPCINLVDADFPLFSLRGLGNVTKIIFSHVLGGIAVPVFFVISGYLFFANFRDWTWSGYKKKLGSRFKSLVIPYILWNCIAIISMLGGLLLQGKPADLIYRFLLDNNYHLFYDYNVWGTAQTNWLGNNLVYSGPMLVPLWFVRDLIFVTILTPLIFYCIKHLKLFYIGVLFLAYISRIWPNIPGLHIVSVFYFSLGAYFSINGKNIVCFATKYKSVILPLFAVLFTLTVIFDASNTTIGRNILPFFACTSVFTLFYLMSYCIRKLDFQPSKLLASSCFFIYALHGLKLPLTGSPINIARKIISILIPGQTSFEYGISYLCTPFLTAAICICILLVARKLFPKTTLLFTGNK